MWSGIQFNGAGKLVGTPRQNRYESALYVGSTLTFTPQGDHIVYAAGSGNENAKKLKRGLFGNDQPVEFGFPAKNYNVLHAGR